MMSCFVPNIQSYVSKTYAKCLLLSTIMFILLRYDFVVLVSCLCTSLLNLLGKWGQSVVMEVCSDCVRNVRNYLIS